MKQSKLIKVYTLLMLALLLPAGCTPETDSADLPSQITRDQRPAGEEVREKTREKVDEPEHVVSRPVTYKVEPETFSLEILKDDIWVPVSLPISGRRVEGFYQNEKESTWSYPDDGVKVSVKAQAEYLEVSITSETEGDHEFSWPDIAGDTYYLPLGEGKRIPADDPIWAGYLSGREFDVLEQLSMPFWAAGQGDCAVMFILEHPYRNTLRFTEGGRIAFSLHQRYPELDDQKDHVFRIYVTENSPAAAARIYRSYVTEKGDFVTLEEKAAANPNIRKLYGAPHIYLAGDFVISPDDIDWQSFRRALGSDPMDYVISYGEALETGEEMRDTVREIAVQDYVSGYQKQVVCRYLSEVLKQEDFIEKANLSGGDNDTEVPAEPAEPAEPDRASMIRENKQALAAGFPEVFRPVDTWMAGETTDLLKEMKQSGIGQAWIGLHSWEQALARPELTTAAIGQGYLIGAYDSYHSIHEPGAEQWITAAFADTTLYDNASVTKPNGEKYAGFQNVGRKLNPTLSLPAVKTRMQTVLGTPAEFNSWFIDCDATGEVYDDYSSGHMTTQQQDLQARLERMAYIRDTYRMVIGSEGGHDFAASTIAFAHGIELKSFAWMDEDMKTNQQSEYYLGKYYNPGGGVPEHFAKRVPVKEDLYQVFAAPEYDIPLFKLVYNDAVITTYHWDWSTFKMIGATNDRMLREVLYNMPPLYHLDSAEWERYKDDIITHTTVWSDFSKQVINREMTGFEDLAGDGQVQLCQYGDDISVIANFGNETFTYEGREIRGDSLLIINGNEALFYSPQVSEENR